nr:BPK_HP1_G0043270.mRNA.1.CDS.1 [Saccharomyces cerevisiae]
MTHKKYGNCQMVFQPSPGGFSSGTNEEEEDEEVEDIDPLPLFTDNESNLVKLFNEEKNPSEYTKDAFEEYLVQGKTDAVNPENKGTKACAVYHFKNIPPGEYVTVRYKFTNDPKNSIFKAQNLAVVDEDEFDLIFDNREEEADNFYWRITPCQSVMN